MSAEIAIGAAELFEDLGGHGDSAAPAERCRDLAVDPAAKLRVAVAAAAVGGTVEFGRYPQKEDSGAAPEPIEWRVLSKEGGVAVLISRCALDCRGLNASTSQGNNWETSDLKAWLQGDFAREAGLTGLVGSLTCLSVDEANRYFKNATDRVCEPTGYARKQGAHRNDGTGGCRWWLRSPGGYGCVYAANVYEDGRVWSNGISVADSSSAVRPALKLDL